MRILKRLTRKGGPLSLCATWHRKHGVFLRDRWDWQEMVKSYIFAKNSRDEVAVWHVRLGGPFADDGSNFFRRAGHHLVPVALVLSRHGPS